MSRIPSLWDSLRSLWGWRAPGGDAVLLSSADAPSFIERQDFHSFDGEQAERLAAVFACVKVLTESVQTSPLAVELMRRGGEWDEDAKHPLSVLWNARPNPLHAPSELVGQVMRGLNLYGNAYLLLMRAKRTGEVGEIVPLDETIVDVDVDERWFRYRDQPAIVYYVDGQSLPHDPMRPDICHVRWNTRPWYPFEGRSPVGALREQIGAGIAATEYQRRIFSQGGHAQIGLQPLPAETANMLAAKQAKEDAEEFRKATTGSATWNRVPVIPAGYNVVQLGISPKDAAYIDLMKWSRNEVASCYRVPLVLLGDLEKSSYANVREIMRSFERQTMAPIRKVIGDALHRDLLLRDPRYRITWQPDVKDAPETAVKVFAAGIKSGMLTPKDAADMMGWTYDEDNPPSDEYHDSASAGDKADWMGQNPPGDGDDEDEGGPDPDEGPTGDGPDPVDENG